MYKKYNILCTHDGSHISHKVLLIYLTLFNFDLSILLQIDLLHHALPTPILMTTVYSIAATFQLPKLQYLKCNIGRDMTSFCLFFIIVVIGRNSIALAPWPCWCSFLCTCLAWLR